MPVEISLNAVRFARQNDLTITDYYNSMMDNIDEVTDKRVIALGAIEKDKIMVARCRCFETRGVPGSTSELSPRAPAQMGRREAEREGGKGSSRREAGVREWIPRPSC